MRRQSNHIGWMVLATCLAACGDDTTEPSANETDDGTTDTGDVNAETFEPDTTLGTSEGSSGAVDTTAASESTTDDGEDDTSTGEPPQDVCPPVASTRIGGDTIGGLAGWKVSMAGDFDGDGVGDYAISTPRADEGVTTDQGRVHVVRGGVGYDDFDLSAVSDGVEGWVITGEDSNHRAGEYLAGAGDVNGDGKDDLLIGSVVGAFGGAPEDSGRWSVVYGQDLTSTDEPILLADVRQGVGGFAIDGRLNIVFPGFSGSGTGTGDINGDGLSDILFGSPLASGLTGPGYVELIYGSEDNPGSILLDETGPAADQGVEFFTPTGFTGFVIGAGGDVNGDGIRDFLFGANPSGTTVVYVVLGGDDVGTRTIDGLEAGEGGFAIDMDFADTILQYGAFTILGDVNGDGMDDVGFSVQNPIIADGTPVGAGVVWGKNDTERVSMEGTLTGVGGFVSTRGEGDEQLLLGKVVGAAGDINADGYADFYTVSAADPATALMGDDLRGRIYVIYGGEDLSAVDLGDIEQDQGGFLIEGPELNDDFGRDIAAGQDINGDGIPDLIVGAPQDGLLGSVHVIYGFNETCPRAQ